MNNSIKFIPPEELCEVEFTFAILIAKHQDKWVFVRHRERDTWELPAGHVEPGEDVDDAAERELREETGARDYKISPLAAYEGTWQGEKVFGKLFFAEISQLGPLPDFEIAEVRLFDDVPENLTYPEVQLAFLGWYSV